MTVPGEVVRTRGKRFAIFFLWVILIFSELGLLFALHEEAGRYVRSPPRKTRFFFDTQSLRAAPPTSGQLADREADSYSSAGKIYEDDKRIIHTGPNPLHN